MAQIMHADAARRISDEHRDEINNVLVQKHLSEIMGLIAQQAVRGLYVLHNPFKSINGPVLQMLCTRLRELGYEIEFNVGEDGPNRPGHDELRWNR